LKEGREVAVVTLVGKLAWLAVRLRISN